MARHVEDLQTLMPILLGPDGLDHTVVPMPYGSPPQRLRIAFFTGNGIAPVDEDTAAIVRRAAQWLGAEERVPPCVECSYDLEMKILGADGGDGLRQFLNSIGSHQTHPLLDGWLAKLEPYRTDVAGFADYWAQLFEFRAHMHAFMRDYDALLSPVYATPALQHGASVEEASFRGFSYTMTHNLTGWPAGVVRCGTSHSGLPIGLQVAAHPWREDVVLEVLRKLDTEFGGWRAPEGA
jgi:amidase